MVSLPEFDWCLVHPWLTLGWFWVDVKQFHVHLSCHVHKTHDSIAGRRLGGTNRNWRTNRKGSHQPISNRGKAQVPPTRHPRPRWKLLFHDFLIPYLNWTATDASCCLNHRHDTSACCWHFGQVAPLRPPRLSLAILVDFLICSNILSVINSQVGSGQILLYLAYCFVGMLPCPGLQ